MTRVLVVEDEPDVSKLIQHSLRRNEQFDLQFAHTGSEALQAVADQPPQIIILDLNLPVVSGTEVCRILRQRPATAGIPILMLTARATENDRVAGLEMGADDYMTKPFSPRELDARVKALLRRGPVTGAQDKATLFYRGERLVVDFDAVSIAVDGAQVHLTRREFELLRCLVQNRNRVMSRDKLLDRVWGDEQMETRSVDVHIGRLRGKLGPAGRHIETIVGLGYRFVD